MSNFSFDVSNLVFFKKEHALEQQQAWTQGGRKDEENAETIK